MPKWATSHAWVSTFNEDIPPRQSQDQGTNALGPHLMQLCEDTSMVLCTGRTPWIPQPPPAAPGATRDLTTPWSVPALSIHPRLRHLFPNSRLRPLPPCHESPSALHAPIHAFHTQHPLRHTPVTRCVWDSTKRPAYANSLQSPTCDQLLQHSIHLSSMHQLNQADNAFTSAQTTASRSAGFRQKKPAFSSSTPT